MQTQTTDVRIEFEDDGAIAVLTMQRPEKRNALSSDMMRQLVNAFKQVSEREGVAVIILRGEGAAFSAGHDLKELQCTQDATGIFDVCVELMQTIQSIPQPVIAEIATIATAAGCQLVATCDLAIASVEARFATPGVRIGLFCSTPMAALSRTISRKRAMEMLLTGDFIDAKTAQDWGLINHAVPAAELHGETLALARKVASASRRVVALGKSAFYRQIDLDTDEAYAFTKGVMTRNAASVDAHEGIAAFLEKRRPVWDR